MLCHTHHFKNTAGNDEYCIYCERDGLAALVGTIRELTGCTKRNVADVIPQTHSHEIMEQFDKLKLQVEQLQKIALAASGVVGYDAHRGPGMCTCDFCTRLRCALTPWAEDQRTDLKRKEL